MAVPQPQSGVPSAVRGWIGFALLIVAHFAVRPLFASRASVDFLLIAVLFSAVRMRPGVAAIVGLAAGVVVDALAPSVFGARWCEQREKHDSNHQVSGDNQVVQPVKRLARVWPNELIQDRCREQDAKGDVAGAKASEDGICCCKGDQQGHTEEAEAVANRQ